MDAKIPRRVMTVVAELSMAGAQILLASDKGASVLVAEWDDGSMVLMRDGKTRGDGEVCLKLEKALPSLLACTEKEISVTISGGSATLFPCAVVPATASKSNWRARLKGMKPGLPGIAPTIHVFLMGILEKWFGTKQHGMFVLAGTIDKGKAAVYVHDQTDGAIVVLPLSGKSKGVPAWVTSL